MKVKSVDVFFRDDERASGTVSADNCEQIPWTAIKSSGRVWYVVLHGKIELKDAGLHRLFLDAVQNTLQYRAAA